MIVVKKHEVTEDGRMILAVCDKEILGKTFEEGDLQLDLSSDFYQGEEVSEDEVKKLFDVASIINMVGEKSVGLGIEKKIISKSKIITVQGIPHAQAIL